MLEGFHEFAFFNSAEASVFAAGLSQFDKEVRVACFRSCKMSSLEVPQTLACLKHHVDSDQIQASI
jgi:hypothetical protein